MMNNDGGGGEILPDEDADGEDANLAPTVAIPTVNPPTQVTQVPGAATPSPAATVSAQPLLASSPGVFNVASEFEPLFANRFSTPLTANKPAASPEPTRPVQPAQSPAARTEPAPAVQSAAASDEAEVEELENQGGETGALYAAWETDLDKGTESDEGDLPGWEFTLPDDTEDESA